jgi:hypothetical protein
METGGAPTWTITRDTSPWRGFTATAVEEEANMHVASSDLAGYASIPSLVAYDIDGTPLLARNEDERRVVANERFFFDLTRADATRVTGRTAIGVFKDTTFASLSPAALAAFLLESQIVITYWHVEALLTRVMETETGKMYTARFRGEHTYFTNEKNSSSLDFALEIDKISGHLFLCP